MDKSRSSASTLNATGWSPMGELGVSYELNPDVRLSMGYQYIGGIGDSKTGDYDSYALIAGLSYTFGSQKQDLLTTETSEMVMPPRAFVFSAQSLGESYAFNTNSAELGRVFKAALKQVADILTTYPQSQVLIVGHTDSVGAELANQALSERRAQSVADILERMGVKASQIQATGKGETSPIKNNDTKEGRALNRRVELTIPEFEYLP